MTIRIFFKFIVAVLSVLFSAQRSEGFFKLVDRFHQFDTFTLKIQLPTVLKTKIFYLLYALSIELYYLLISIRYSKMNATILLIWTWVSISILLMIIQYASFVNIIRQGYKMANYVFSSSKYATEKSTNE